MKDAGQLQRMSQGFNFKKKLKAAFKKWTLPFTENFYDPKSFYFACINQAMEKTVSLYSQAKWYEKFKLFSF